MRRGPSGRYETVRVGGEPVRSFIPLPLPPAPPIAMDPSLQALLEKALLELGRLDGVSNLLPEPDILLYAYIRKEAVLSSQIEGTQSSLSDLLLFEIAEAPGAPLQDVVETSNYVAALEFGLARLKDGFPLSLRLLREIHGTLLAHGRGSDQLPGEFRRSQNWIGGSRPGNAHFVPPPPHMVVKLMGDLENFLHARDTSLGILTRVALAHAQFETIHPFLDGNGRLGRLLITLLLWDAGVLSQPLLYLSLFFKQNRAEYYRLLDLVRSDGDWEAWIAFFLQGVAETASGAVRAAKQLTAISDADRERVQGNGRAAGSGLRVHAVLRERAILSVRYAAERTGLSFPATANAVQLLERLGIVREVTGRRRDRLYAYERYLAVLAEGLEPL